MSIVVDASIALSWRFDDERTDAADAVLRDVGEFGALAPNLWPLEVANALQIAVRRGRISAAYRDASLRDLGALGVAIDADTAIHAWSTTLALAVAHGLTIYDAAYLELALRRKARLASLDQKLRAAGLALGLTLLGV